MVYESQINFTLDTICPWTYIAKKRLEEALQQVRATNPPVIFKLHYSPYQLLPDLPTEGQDKYKWYIETVHHGDEERMKKYTTLMSAYGASVGIQFKFGGTISNTLDAHRVIQHFQEAKGEEVADKIIDSLYAQYFKQERNPCSKSTLLTATRAADIPDSEAEPVIDNHHEGLQEVKMMIQEQKGNGVDAVPYITIEGRRRDFTLEGAKEVAEYVKALDTVVKEIS